MLEPLMAVALAGNIFQFIDFGLKATSKARELHTSASGALEENIQLEYLAKHVSVQLLRVDSGCESLDNICSRCASAATELLAALKGLKVSGQTSKVQSVRKALKSASGIQKLEGMRARLESLRNEVQFCLLVDLRSSIDVQSAKNHARFDDLNEYSKAVLESISLGHNFIQSSIQGQDARFDERIQQAVVQISATQESTQSVLLESVSSYTETISSAISTNVAEIHESLRTEGQITGLRHQESTSIVVANQETLHLSTQHSLETLRAVEDMARRDGELKGLLLQMVQTRNPASREKLRERSNAVTVTLCALVTTYEKTFASLNGQAKLLPTMPILFPWAARPQDPNTTLETERANDKKRRIQIMGRQGDIDTVSVDPSMLPDEFQFFSPPHSEILFPAFNSVVPYPNCFVEPWPYTGFVEDLEMSVLESDEELIDLAT